MPEITTTKIHTHSNHTRKTCYGTLQIIRKGQWKKINDARYPYEFTVPLEKDENFEFFTEGLALDGTVNKSKTKILYQ